MKKIIVSVSLEKQFEDAEYDAIMGYMSKDAYADYMVKVMSDADAEIIKASITFADGVTLTRETKK